MITLDGVMQAPGGPEEDPSDGFQFGGWVAPYGDDTGNKAIQKEMNQPVDYLLGRKTFDIWADYWPKHAAVWPGINNGTKYVLSNTLKSSDWEKTVFLKDIEDIKKLKSSEGPDLQVWGSSKLVRLLLEHDLVDEMRLKIYPLILGQGKHLFPNGAIPAAFTLTECTATSKSVILASYSRSGEVKTGDLTV